ncbi:MAG: porin family protein, partial [Saprospiraceae bacterium]|nr:porin family protein [Saprospiraceae bacterium]
MKNQVVLILLVTALMVTISANAQNQFSLEIRSGADFATQDLGDVPLKTGYGFEGILNYDFIANLGIYGGWGWNKFAADSDDAGVENDFEETGYMLGLSGLIPLGDGGVGIYARAGGIYNHIEIENVAGDINEDSGHGWGWQLSAGVDLSLGSGWQL